jgi:hypothetical protein
MTRPLFSIPSRGLAQVEPKVGMWQAHAHASGQEVAPLDPQPMQIPVGMPAAHPNPPSSMACPLARRMAYAVQWGLPVCGEDARRRWPHRRYRYVVG